MSEQFLQIRQALQGAGAKLAAVGADAPVLDARILLEYASGLSREAMIAAPDAALPSEALERFEALVARRGKREPISHIVGKKEFYGREFLVTPDVLTPRPETETLIEAVLGRIRGSGFRIQDSGFRILDLGTGSGCLLLTLLSELPYAAGLGVDISAAALRVARENAARLGLNARAEFALGNWCENVTGSFEIIVANPPYIPSNAIPKLMPEVAAHEPHVSLSGGEDGLECYRAIAATLGPHAKSGAWVALEVGAGQHEAVAEIFMRAGFRPDAPLADLSGVVRCVAFKGPAE